jgi:hypothetical protein
MADTDTHPAQLAEARGWLADCGMRADLMTDAAVISTVGRAYDGGWVGFLADTACLVPDA